LHLARVRQHFFVSLKTPPRTCAASNTAHRDARGAQRGTMAEASTACANTTTASRHALLEQRILSTVGPAGKAPHDVLVLNTIDHHYTEIIGAWKAMVLAAPFPKSLFVVAMDQAARQSCLSFALPHYLPREIGTTDCMGSLNVGMAVGGEARLPGSYRRVKIQGKEGDTRILPPDLPSWKMHAVWAALSTGWRALFSESDVLWVPEAGARLASHLLAAPDEHDFAPQRHPMTPVWNFGFFLAQGPRTAAFFSCGVREWDQRQSVARHSGRAVDIGSDQRFLWDTWRKRTCGALRVRKLPLGLYPTCRDWVGATRREALVVHVTYCHRLSMMLSSEDGCKRRVLDAFYARVTAEGSGISVANLSSEGWNQQLGC